MDTVWILGDQLNRQISSLRDADPATTHILFVTSEAKLRSKVWHRQRLHLVLTGMARFAEDLRAEGFEVDHRQAPTLASGLAEHRRHHHPKVVRVMEPMSWDTQGWLERADVEIVASNQFLCHRKDFADWAASRGRRRLVMEDFYRWQRQRLGYLMDGDEPAGGAWNFDHDNREPPPRDGRKWPAVPTDDLDAVDRAVLRQLDDFETFGSDPAGTWATSRARALVRLHGFIDDVLPRFGPHEDAMLADEWRLAHSAKASNYRVGCAGTERLFKVVVTDITSLLRDLHGK